MALNNSHLFLVFFVSLLSSSYLYEVKAKGEPSLLSSYIDKVKGDNEIQEDEFPFSYTMGAWNGPQNWGKLKPEWRLCGEGKSQSPINIQDHNTVFSPSLGDLVKHYKPAYATLHTETHEVMVEWTEDAGGIEINGSEYKLVQCHWHTPSEHAFHEPSFPLELHVVHVNSNDDIAVVGILYRLGVADPFLDLVLQNLPSSDLGVVDPLWINLEDREYYRYNGSLTTPPCSENVTWTVFKTVRTASRNQVMRLRSAIQEGINARPKQPLHGRTVYSYKPTSSI